MAPKQHYSGGGGQTSKQLQVSIMPVPPGMVKSRSCEDFEDAGAGRTGDHGYGGGGGGGGFEPVGRSVSTSDVGGADANGEADGAGDGGGGRFKRALHGMSKLWSPDARDGTGGRAADPVGVRPRGGGDNAERGHPQQRLRVTLPQLPPGMFDANGGGDGRSGDSTSRGGRSEGRRGTRRAVEEGDETRESSSSSYPDDSRVETLHSDSTLTSRFSPAGAAVPRQGGGAASSRDEEYFAYSGVDVRTPNRPTGRNAAGKKSFTAGDLSALRGFSSTSDVGGGGAQNDALSPVFTETGASTTIAGIDDEDGLNQTLSRISGRISLAKIAGGHVGRGSYPAPSYDLSAALASAATASASAAGDTTTSPEQRSITTKQAERLVFGDGLLSSGTETTGETEESETDHHRRRDSGGKRLPSARIQHLHDEYDPYGRHSYHGRPSPPLPDRATTSSSSSINASRSSSCEEEEEDDDERGEDYFSTGGSAAGAGMHRPLHYNVTPATSSYQPRPRGLPRQRSSGVHHHVDFDSSAHDPSAHGPTSSHGGPPLGSIPLHDDAPPDVAPTRVNVTPLARIPYVHGGYAPAAPLMLHDGRWMEILRRLMPEAYAGAAALLRHAAESAPAASAADKALDQARVMKWAENNPVVAAYGMMNSEGGCDGGGNGDGNGSGDGNGGTEGEGPAAAERAPPPPVPVVDSRFSAQRRRRRRRWQGGGHGGSFSSGAAASSSHYPSPMPSTHGSSSGGGGRWEESFGASEHTRGGDPRDPKSSSPSNNSNFKPKPALEWDVFLDPVLVRHVERSLQAAEDLNIRARRSPTEVFYEEQIAADVEVDRQVARLLDRMILAHGSTTQLVAEAVGMAPRYNFSRVVEMGESKRRSESRRRRARSGGSGGSIISKMIRKKTPSKQAATMQFARSHSIACDASVNTTQQVVATAEAEGVRGSKYAPSSGIFVDRWLSLFAKALRLGREWSNNGGSRFERVLSYRGSVHSAPRFVRAHRSNVSALSDFDASDSVVSGRSVDTATQNPGDAALGDGGPILNAPPMCGIFLCFGMDDPNSVKADHGRSSMADSAGGIAELLGSPLRVVMDLKSRRVPPRVWARLVDNLRSRGLCVDGLGSFNIDELRSIGSFCSTPVTQCIFFHSAGDMQRACHAREVTHGDTVYFNAGSLLWKRPTFCEASGLGWCAAEPTSMNFTDAACGGFKMPGGGAGDGDDIRDGTGAGEEDERENAQDPNNDGSLRFNGHVFQPYAYPREIIESPDSDVVLPDCASTLQDYQRHLNLNIGLYVQEFSIGSGELDALTRLVNAYPAVFNLGLAWGGINGSTVRGVEGDGFWNQRYIGRNWDFDAAPAEHMKLLNPEDHHMWQKAIHAGDWAQLATINQIALDPDEQEGPLVQATLCKPTR